MMWRRYFLILVRSVVFLTLFLVTHYTYSQPGDPGGDPDNPPVPISGIGILIALGIAFGFRKLIGNRKE